MDTPDHKPIARRGFIATMLAAGAAPMFIPARLLGAEAPSKTLHLGCIGVGRMGAANLVGAIGLGKNHGSRVVAVCDVDRIRAEAARDKAEIMMREIHGANHGKVRIYPNYRELIANGDIDGVIISTPDFSHVHIALEAARAGKGIYLEKPLTYSIPEGQALVKAVRKHGVVLQTGSQQRSSLYFHRVCWLARNGRIGEIREIEVTLPLDSGHGSAAAAPVPENLDYTGWMGCTPDQPYTVDRCHPQGAKEINTRPGWMQISDYARGNVSNWGAHNYDMAQWALGTDHDSGPVEIQAVGDFPDRGLFNVHTRFTATARYANGAVLKSGSGNVGTVRITGSEGWLEVQRGGFKAGNPEILREQPTGGIELVTSPNHMGDFIDCLRSGKEPVAPVEVGHRTNSICILHHLAMVTGRTIKWDPASETVVDDPAAAAMLHRQYREGFELPEI
jgi:predicted dehydrogenase